MCERLRDCEVKLRLVCEWLNMCVTVSQEKLWSLFSLFTFICLLEMGLRSPGLCSSRLFRLSHPASQAAFGGMYTFDAKLGRTSGSLPEEQLTRPLPWDTISTCPQSPSLPFTMCTAHTCTHTHTRVFCPLPYVWPRVHSKEHNPLACSHSHDAYDHKCTCHPFGPPRHPPSQTHKCCLPIPVTCA